MYLQRVNSPEDLKKLRLEELEILAGEIRDFIIHSVSKTGGHLASNLGAVELTMMLHYMFDSPKDKFIFDVGHQVYTHKIITGRKDRFHLMRQKDGLSGFPKRDESEHDIAETGHASTSISTGLGINLANRIMKDDSKVISIIGDGALTGGLALEAVNNAGHIPNNLIIVVNNNEMSIGSNIGGFSRYLNKVLQQPRIQSAKNSFENAIEKLPFGSHTRDLLERVEAAVKAFTAPGIIFRELGFSYVGPVDGHNVKDLEESFKYVKSLNSPVLVQVNTKKGKGYEHSELMPSLYHGVGRFDVQTGKSESKKKESFSKVFGEHIVEMAGRDERIAAVSAAMTDGTGLRAFSEKYAERFFDVGIAEGHAVTFAAGLALGGMRPFAAIYSTFLQRAYDSVIHDVSLMKLPVTFMIDRAGLVPDDGETHQGIFDVAYLRIIPEIEIISPLCAEDLKLAMEYSLSRNNPLAIRYPKSQAEESCPGLYPLDGYEEMKAHSARKGSEGLVISYGVTLITAAKVIDELGAELELINPMRLAPLDETGLIDAISRHSKVIIFEEGARCGGFVSSVLELMNEHGIYKPLTVVAVENEFVETAARDELLAKYSLDYDGIKTKLENFIES